MKRTLVCLLLLLFCATVALAEPALDARLENGRLALRWTGCDCPEATLTVYRDGWPVLVSSVRGIDGSFDVPLWYTQEAGDYAAQLRCSDGCVRVETESVDTTPTAQTPEQTAVATPLPAATSPPSRRRSFARQTWNAHRAA